MLWFNFALGAELGITPPGARSLDRRLEHELLATCSLQCDVRSAARGSRVLHADRYGGIGTAGHAGSARGGFLGHGDLFLKGIGKTPLWRPNADINHSYGGATLVEGVLEAIHGEVAQRLFSRGGARVLAIVDQGRYMQFDDGAREPTGVTVRFGTGLRVGHLLGDVRGSIATLFCKLARATDLLVMQASGNRPDVRATMLGILRRHAVTAAEQFRFRIVHGAPSASNMQLGGGMLDTTMLSALPRTAAVRTDAHSHSAFCFGREHLARASELGQVYAAVRAGLTERDRRRLNAAPIDFTREMEAAYAEAMAIQWLRAAGLPPSARSAISRDHPKLTGALAKVLDALARLSTLPPGKQLLLPRVGDLTVMRPPSVVDVFALLSAAPLAFLEPRRARQRTLERALASSFAPGRAGKRQRRVVRRLLERFSVLYEELLESLGARLRIDGRETARRLARRARFENRPLERLYRPVLYGQILAMLRAYLRTSNRSLVDRFIAGVIRGSARSLEARRSPQSASRR